MRLLVTLPVAVTMTVFAAPVHADGDDATFLAMLNQRGITYNSADQAVTAGKSVCQLLDSGKSDADVLKEVESRNPGIHDLNKAFAFMAVSSDNYCPKYLGTGGAKSEDS